MLLHTPIQSRRGRAAFSLVELLVVVVIISILMTVGASIVTGLTGGKSVTAAVANVEAMVDEARSIAVSKGLNACIMVDVNDPTQMNRYLRRIVVAYQSTDQNGKPTNYWTLSSRGYVLPDGVFFSQTYSKSNQQNGTSLGSPYSFSPSTSPGMDVGPAEYQGKYITYVFNSEGICQTPGASFIVGSGARPTGKAPLVTGSAKRDFGGFVIWNDGHTSLFRSPQQMGLPTTITNF